MRFRLYPTLLSAFILVSSATVTQADGITGSVIDSSGNLVACRLYISNTESGEWFYATSLGGTAVTCEKQSRNPGSFEKHTALSAHRFKCELPAGKYTVRAERGKQYLPAETTVEVQQGKDVSVELQLRTFIVMQERGWYSGDGHIHQDINDVPTLIQAENVNVGLPLTYWVRDSSQIPANDGSIYRPRASWVDNSHLIYPVNTEYEIFSINGKPHTQGAVLVLNHRKPLTKPTPPARPIAEAAREQGALLDLEKHSWNWSLMIVPVMNVDLFELSNNHHWKTEFGLPQWTLENSPRDWPEIEINDAGFTEMGWTEFGLQTYYSLVNCGFRLRVTAGTAFGVHPVPLGHSRVYVHCADRFDFKNWIRNLNAGHSFVTNGPLLDVRFNGALPGAQWNRSTPENRLHITGTVAGLNPVKSVQIIRNGEIAAELDVQSVKQEDGTFRAELDTTVSVEGTGWVAVRCFEDLPRDKVSFAHTNPVYIDVPNAPLRPRKKRVQFFVQRMEEEIQRNTGILPEDAVDEFRYAKKVYEDILATARD